MKIIITKPDQSFLDENNIYNWPIWTCETSRFTWSYTEKEACYILKGKVEVVTDEERVEFGPGDFVVFPAGLSCEWIVHVPVRKHYKMG